MFGAMFFKQAVWLRSALSVSISGRAGRGTVWVGRGVQGWGREQGCAPSPGPQEGMQGLNRRKLRKQTPAARTFISSTFIYTLLLFLKISARPTGTRPPAPWPSLCRGDSRTEWLLPKSQAELPVLLPLPPTAGADTSGIRSS